MYKCKMSYESNLASAAPKSSQIKVAFFDIDGTIYRADHTISQRTVAALKTLKSGGIKVCLATGRPYFGAHKIIEQLSITDGSVFFSGALAINPETEREIFSATIQSKDIRELIETLYTNQIYLEYYSFDEYYVNKTNHITEMHKTYLHKAPLQFELDAILNIDHFYKLVAISETPKKTALIREIVSNFPQFAYGLSCGASHPDILFVNITSPLASRENIFEVMLKHFSVTPDQVISFGDAESDLPFILRSGIGVTLDNAPTSVKEQAPYITSSVENDGVAEALQILGLI